MVAGQVSKPSVFQCDTLFPPEAMAATGESVMPLPIDFVINERVENILLGIAQQIEGAMTTVKSEMTGLVTEAELRWQTRLAGQIEASERDRDKFPQTASRPFALGSRRTSRRPASCSELRTQSFSSSNKAYANWSNRPDARRRRRLNYLSNGPTSCSTR